MIVLAIALGPKTLIFGPFTNLFIKELTNDVLPRVQKYDIAAFSILGVLGLLVNPIELFLSTLAKIHKIRGKNVTIQD